MSGWIEALNALPLAGLMLVISLGYSLGRVTIRGVSLGPPGATLFVALALGFLGFEAGTGPAAKGVAKLGFVLFIYSVGFDAAPHFFACFREQRGWRFVGVGVLVITLATALSVASARWLGLDASSAAGLLAGALTSAPTYAAAAELAPDATHLSVAFAISYPFGLLGIVLLLQLVPRLLKVDLARDAHSDDEIRDGRPRRGVRYSGRAPEWTRVFAVSAPDVVGHSLAELDLMRRTGCVIERLHRAGSVSIPDAGCVFEVGDHVMARGRVDELRELERVIGPEIDARGFEADELPMRRVQVRRRAVVGRSLAELQLLGRFHCVVTRVERGVLWIEPDAETTLVRDDVLEVVGRRVDLRALASELGRFEPSLAETDIAVYAGGIFLGLLIGRLHVHLFGLDLSLGMGTGLLLMGLLLGWQQRLGPFRTHVPREARQLVRDLGILLFLGETSLVAGAGLHQGLAAAPWRILAAGAFVNVLSVAGALVVARRVLHLRPLDAWGSLCGGLTSAAALQTVRRVSDSNEAALSYAAAYAVASVMATLAGPLLVLLLR